MNIDEQEKARSILPRWRNFRTTLALGELIPAGSPPITEDRRSIIHLRPNLLDWELNRSLPFATDLIGAALELGISEGIEDAVAFILDASSKSTELQKRIARFASGNRSVPLVKDLQIDLDSSKLIHQSQENIRRLRADLRRSLRNPIKLVELSRQFVILGHLEKAIRTMDIAVSLGPSNRFVVRSAVRLYVHSGQFDKAHWVVRRAENLRSDPWLLAAEIAVASLRDLTSRNLKIGKEIFSDANFSPFELSELGSAIATVELNNANAKRSRKTFRKALKQPTDNSLAQVEWAKRKMNFEIDTQEFDVPLNYEAPAWDSYLNGDLAAAIGYGKNWILDQPFSPSPAIFTGMTAALSEDYRTALDVLAFGLAANPDHVTLRNNLAFALASDNSPELAQVELNKINRLKLSPTEQIVVTATEGLIKFRRGHVAEGRACYWKAIKIATDNKEGGYAMRALLFLAREEIEAKTELAERAFESATEVSGNFSPNTELRTMISRLDRRLKESKPEEPKTRRK